MERFKIYTQSDITKITDYRSGEVKFGEKVLLSLKERSLEQNLIDTDAKYILLGIPEDIGVKANNGRMGTCSAWENAIKSIVNIQHNKFCKGNRILVLGAFDFTQEIEIAKNLDYNNSDDKSILYQLVQNIDKEVSHLICKIIKAGKIPIIIGGGHNNAYGNIKGTALAYGKAINCINFDAHSDFRILEGRHSGNGFSYAYEEGFLKKYFIFGLHESYTSKSVLDIIKKTDERVTYNTYDEVKIRNTKNFESELITAKNFIDQTYYGIEIDLDSIPNIPASAITSSGYSVEELRQFIYFMGNDDNVAYLHICEGAPILGDEKNPNLVGKLISYLVTDFIKANYKE